MFVQFIPILKLINMTYKTNYTGKNQVKSGFIPSEYVVTNNVDPSVLFFNNRSL